ncbi:PilZ domain-containing protein [Pseudobacteriovorax antillogorgiicola]|uniref:PilZ domain-containing protein n=1 Tax=Pseudobacteriovorax antillogorgiicola TaxID=1513793 RepID=A0A1Y6C7I3_9BACT|nr:PilZ domain-containing protein [Pseudobacteriovorax antillogorgiicola]TCS50713.1 PilZ domain-containing protein [Pseudobacteriovorax antillogorgiicola]SMF40639.1 PilZ domain-containing protein [Pseudobacteriovorax antillogorgiicola]
MSLVNLDKSLGNMRGAISDEVIEYEPFEFSTFSLGIISPENMIEGTHVVMETHRSGRILFQVIAKSHHQHKKLYRYRLTCVDKDVDLSRVLEIDPRSGRIKFERLGSHLQYARFIMNPRIHVQSKTFGSADSYLLEGVDISKTGMLLCSPHPFGTIPFIDNTLLEVRLDTDRTFSAQPLQSLCKVVRHYQEGVRDTATRYYAVRFVEFTHDEQVAWDHLISNIEHTAISSAKVSLAA